jgi:beta-N-acetylhexosaminidase
MNDWKRLAGAVLMVGFEGTAPGERLRALQPAGFILFDRNLESPEQTGRLINRLSKLLPGPPLLALDQEGGRVSRLEPFIGPTPTATALARAGSKTAREFGFETGRALHALGFNIDFAPVVDLCRPEATNGIGDRSFGTDPGRVAEIAGGFLDGLQSAGVAGCLKHFPGLGRTAVDSHSEMPVADLDLAKLEAEDLLPFARLGGRAAAVMIGHAHYPALNPDRELPASCSREVVCGLLRERLGFGGLVVSDDLEMGAVSSLDRDGAAALAALRAGCDLLLYCRDLDRAEAASEAIARAAAENQAVGRRLSDAAAAVKRMAEAWPAAESSASRWEAARGRFDVFSAFC